MEGAVVVNAGARSNFRLWLRFANGVEGLVDLSDLAGRGVFDRWLKPGEFEKVVVDTDWGTIRWPAGSTAAEPELDLCPDVLYYRLTGAALPGAESEVA